MFYLQYWYRIFPEETIFDPVSHGLYETYYEDLYE